MIKRIFLLLLALALLPLCGCAALLEREYSAVAPHSATYWESEAAGILRAQTYQDVVNDLLFLITSQTEDGIIRLLGNESWDDPTSVAERACTEVEQETPLGAYAVEYITYSCTQSRNYSEISVHIVYRRTLDQQRAIVNATGMYAISDLLTAAIERGESELAVRVSYFNTDRRSVVSTVAALFGASWGEADAQDQASSDSAVPSDDAAELPPFPTLAHDGYEVIFYPNTDEAGIVEVLWDSETLAERAQEADFSETSQNSENRD
ncbi:MAG: hypothetical protein IJF15_01010 [Oscillospiraceae bacterium]|nr:hypothetical protein [Oscillospiraceae bacterium]